MTKENALRKIREKANTFVDFLQADKDDKTVNIVDPTWEVTEINNAVNACQFLIEYCSLKITEEENEKLADEVFEDDNIRTLDDDLKERGLHRGMY